MAGPYLAVPGVDDDEEEPVGGVVVVVVLLLPGGVVVVVELLPSVPPALPVAPPVVPLAPGALLALGALPVEDSGALLVVPAALPVVPLVVPALLPVVPELGALLVAPPGASADSFFPQAVNARVVTSAASNTECFILVPLKKYSCRLSARLIGGTRRV